jgi:hypothetical protein
MIRARTDAAATDGINEVIERLNLYAEAGADIVFADALLSVDESRWWRRMCASACGQHGLRTDRTRHDAGLSRPSDSRRSASATVSYRACSPVRRYAA